MKIDSALLQHKDELQAKNYLLPTYDVEAVKAATFARPKWVHMGAGNIFRAFPAACQQHLLNNGHAETGIVVAEGYDTEIVDFLRNHGGYTINATLKSDGAFQKEIIASLAEFIKADKNSPEDYARLVDIFKSESLQMVSMTITEKGYSLVDSRGAQLKLVNEEIAGGPTSAQSYIGRLASLLFERFNAGAYPIAMVSMDNMSSNGKILRDSVLKIANGWLAADHVGADFVSYISDEAQVSFPWSMIDKITPRPATKIEEALIADGLEDIAPIMTSKNTFIAPFVNAEETQYLVIENNFPNGRPALEHAGVIFTDRDTVNKVETMKVTTCLNPLHTALAIYGCLLDYTLISAEMTNPNLVNLVKTLGYKEGLPVVVNPGILDPKEFLDVVLEKRFPNPYIPDSPQRIASDTSQKLSVRFGETVKSYQKSDTLRVDELEAIPFVFAGWLRYLMAVDDLGNAFELSPDPLLAELTPIFKDISLWPDRENTKDYSELLKSILSNAKIFGVNLYDAGLADKVISILGELTAGFGAVQNTLAKYFS
ncbi:MAG: mannitol dehydrogenase family protein [Clostridiales Family XIII bacterium]|nr:mannitol dehydrogenase family protein [Clostridiales Family XIII bacterium]